jgi:hypothetical protein
MTFGILELFFKSITQVFLFCWESTVDRDRTTQKQYCIWIPSWKCLHHRYTSLTVDTIFAQLQSNFILLWVWGALKDLTNMFSHLLSVLPAVQQVAKLNACCQHHWETRQHGSETTYFARGPNSRASVVDAWTVYHHVNTTQEVVCLSGSWMLQAWWPTSRRHYPWYLQTIYTWKTKIRLVWQNLFSNPTLQNRKCASLCRTHTVAHYHYNRSQLRTTLPCHGTNKHQIVLAGAYTKFQYWLLMPALFNVGQVR